MFENTAFYDHLINLNKNSMLQDLKFGCNSIDEFNDICNEVVDNLEISVIHLNIRSLNKNCSELHNFLHLLDLDFDVIVLSEIWPVTSSTLVILRP